MSLIDTFNLCQQSLFNERVLAAIVHAAVAVSAEVSNDVQTVSVSGGPTGGTFTLQGGPLTGTVTVPFNATASGLQTLLTANAGVGAGNAVVTGTSLASGLVITWTGTLGNTPQNLMTIGTNSLTGGASPTPSVAHTTTGVAFVNHTARQALASKILNNPQGYANLLQFGTADNATVQADFPGPSYLPLSGTITGATNANPIAVASTAHGLTNGQSVTIAGVLGNTAANGTFTVTVVDGNHFSIPVTGNGAYTSGGTWTLSETQLSNDIQFVVNSIYSAYL